MSMNQMILNRDNGTLGAKIKSFNRTMFKFNYLTNLKTTFEAQIKKHIPMLKAIKLEQTDQAMYDKLNLAWPDFLSKPYTEILKILEADFAPVIALIRNELITQGYYTREELAEIEEVQPIEEW